MQNDGNQSIKQDAQAASETSEVQKTADEIINSTTKSVTGYVNKLASSEFLSVQDSTIKDLILNAIYEYDQKLKKEKTD